MSSFSISSSDLEILNALTIADSIKKNLNSNSSFESSNIFSNNPTYGHGGSKRTPSTTFSTNDSAICSTYDSVISSKNESSTYSTNMDVNCSTNVDVVSCSNNSDATCSTNIGATCSASFYETYSTTDGAACSTNNSIQGIFRRANKVYTSFQLDSEVCPLLLYIKKYILFYFQLILIILYFFKYQAVLQDIQTVCLMNDLTIEKKGGLEVLSFFTCYQ